MSANKLKNKVNPLIQAELEQQTEVMISVQYELSTAIIESAADIKAGRFNKESAEEHLARLETMKTKGLK